MYHPSRQSFLTPLYHYWVCTQMINAGDYIYFDCVTEHSAVPRWCGGAMCLKGLSGHSHLHVECHRFKFLWCRKCSSRYCSYWQVVNGAHLKWLPNKLWSRGCEVIFLVSMYNVLLWKRLKFFATMNWHLSGFTECWSRISHQVISLSILQRNLKKLTVDIISTGFEPL